MQDAASVALFDRYARLSPQLMGIKVELLPLDTGDTPQQAQAAMQQALEAGSEFIIGPIFSESTAAAAPIAADKGISVLSFSNNTSLARSGVYTFGFSPTEQTERIVGFALKKGKTRIAALVPNSSLGSSVLDAASRVLKDADNELVAVARYAPQGVGIERALSELIPQGSPPKFDALLLPEGGAALGTILRSLAARGVKQPEVQLLGTGLWDDATLVRRVSLDGAWLASSPPDATALFEQRFAANYNYTPQRITSLAYDAVSLAVTLATSGRGFDQSALTNNAGFKGPANGNFRLHSNGTTERSLAILQITGASFNVIDPAPISFMP
jgi:ABC-type branched-subunit amino acid transport system substrate-binding protein